MAKMDNNIAIISLIQLHFIIIILGNVIYNKSVNILASEKSLSSEIVNNINSGKYEWGKYNIFEMWCIINEED